MGGKSTYMRQAALIALLAHCGSFVPARALRLGPLDAHLHPHRRLRRSGLGPLDLHGRNDRGRCHPATAPPSSLVLMDEIGRGTSTFDGLALAFAIARHLIEKNRCLTLFATHYFELTRLAQDYPSCANVHLDAVEHGHRIVFLHAVEEGPASQSYGIQVAALAGIPPAVVRAARKQLREFEQRAAVDPLQPDLFAQSEPEPAATEPHPVLAQLAAIDPDSLSPREALDALYALKKSAG
jgi:DNA mismatch repair protein MutS